MTCKLDEPQAESHHNRIFDPTEETVFTLSRRKGADKWSGFLVVGDETFDVESPGMLKLVRLLIRHQTGEVDIGRIECRFRIIPNRISYYNINNSLIIFKPGRGG
jgi:hypothetical protein